MIIKMAYDTINCTENNNLMKKSDNKQEAN